MNLIKPVEITKYGIVIYQPYTGDKNYVSVQVYFTNINPVFNWLLCDSGEKLIWEKTTKEDTNGTIFIYQTPELLKYGFYRIVSSTFSPNGVTKSGDKLIAVLEDTPKLVIGLPYSIYDAISLN